MTGMTNEKNLLKAQYTCDQTEKLSIDNALQKVWTIPHASKPEK